METKKNKSPKELPLSKSQMDLLMDCHEREILKLQPLIVTQINGAKKLIVNGYIEVRPFTSNGKELMGLYITTRGRQSLNNL